MELIHPRKHQLGSAKVLFVTINLFVFVSLSTNAQTRSSLYRLFVVCQHDQSKYKFLALGTCNGYNKPPCHLHSTLLFSLLLALSPLKREPIVFQDLGRENEVFFFPKRSYFPISQERLLQKDYTRWLIHKSGNHPPTEFKNMRLRTYPFKLTT